MAGSAPQGIAPEIAAPPVPAPEVGATLPPEIIDAIQATQVFVHLFGIELTRPIALLGLAAVLFYFGVALSFVLRLNGSVHWSRVLAASIVVFFLCSPAWSYTLEGNWRDASMPLLDDVFRWASGAAPLPRNLFALGLVILMGMMSWPLMFFIVSSARRLLRPSDPPAAPG